MAGARMSYATLDRHAQEILGEMTASTEEQLASLESATAQMMNRHEDQLRRSRSLYQHVVDELELARAANRGLLEELRECRVMWTGKATRKWTP